MDEPSKSKAGDNAAGPKPELISEPIKPHPGTFDTSAMGRGEPGLPSGFTWRGDSVDITEELSRWKQSSRESSRPDADLYLRRHYYKLRMSDGATWTIYFERQTPRTGDPKQRWFLYTRQSDTETDS